MQKTGAIKSGFNFAFFTNSDSTEPEQAGVPILFLTTESDGDIKAQAKAAGATGWLVKPFVPEQLVKTARKVLGR